MENIKHDLAFLDDKYQSYITIADSFDEDHMEQRNAWMAKADFVGRLIRYLEELMKLKEAEDDKR